MFQGFPCVETIGNGNSIGEVAEDHLLSHLILATKAENASQLDYVIKIIRLPVRRLQVRSS
jgi:hypothetical protein